MGRLDVRDTYRDEGVSSGPPVSIDKAHARLHALAALRQATWEATQFLTYDEVRQYVEGVLREVESDEP